MVAMRRTCALCAAQRVGDAVADADAAGRDGAGEAAEVEAVAQHGLHRHAETVRAGQCRAAGMRSRCSSRCGPVYQGMCSDARATLSPPTAETGMAIASQKPKRSVSSRKSASMARKLLLRPVGEIHLVDGEDDALHADDVENGGVAPRLALHAVARVDQHDGDVGVRGARRHVARVLLVAWAVDDDEAARRGIEVAPGDVDGDALLALGDEAVEQQAEIGMRAAGRRVRRAIDRLALIVVEVGGVPQQAADQRRLAVVDRSARQQVQDAVELAASGARRERLRAWIAVSAVIRSSPLASCSPWRRPDRGR